MANGAGVEGWRGQRVCDHLLDSSGEVVTGGPQVEVSFTLGWQWVPGEKKGGAPKKDGWCARLCTRNLIHNILTTRTSSHRGLLSVRYDQISIHFGASPAAQLSVTHICFTNITLPYYIKHYLAIAVLFHPYVRCFSQLALTILFTVFVVPFVWYNSAFDHFVNHLHK